MKLTSMVLCFVALMILIIPVSAIDDNFHWVGSDSETLTVTSHQTRPYNYQENQPIRLYFPNVELTQKWTQTTMTAPVGDLVVYGGDGVSGWDTTVTLRYGAIDGPQVGTGIFGYNKNGAGTHYLVTALKWDLDLSEYSGVAYIYLDDCDISISSPASYSTQYSATGFSGAIDTSVFFQGMYHHTGVDYPWPYYTLGEIGWTYNSNTYYDYYNTYKYTPYPGFNYLDLNRTTGTKAKAIINIGGVEELNETTFKSTDLEWLSYDTANGTWNVTLENLFGDTETKYLTFVPTIGVSVGTIELNQSSYTEPELIQIDAELIIYDFTNHAYTTYLQWRDDVGNWNTVSYVDYNESIGFFTDDPTKSLVGDIDFYKYEIPLRLRAVLIDFNKNTYVSTTVAESNTVLYNPPAGALYLVTGTVVNADTDAVVSGATVSVTGPMSQSDTTNVNGRFYLYLADGTYTFNTTKSGYEDNVDTGIVINSDTSGIEIPLVPVQTDEGVIYGTITDSDTKDPLNDVHVIFTNTTDTIHAYTASNGYYSVDGFDNDSVYAVRALKTGYYSYNGTITTETSGATHKSFDMVQTNYSATPTPTSVSTYPGGEGYEWTNDDIVTMLRILVPGIFLMMLIFLLLAVMMGFMPNNGGNQGGNSGLGELWRRK